MKIHVSKPAYNGTTRNQNVIPLQEGSVYYTLEFWIIGSPDPRDCKQVLLETGIHYVQMPLKTVFTEWGFGHKHKIEPPMWVNLKSKNLLPGPYCHFNLSPIYIGITYLYFYNQCSCEIF
jgi:hypothetical protein